MRRLAILLSFLSAGCAGATMMQEVALDGLPRHPHIAVEDVSASDGMSDGDGLARELERTRLFDRVDRVAVAAEADLAVRGTIDRTCEHGSFGDAFGLFAAMVSLVGGGGGSLAAIPHYVNEDGGMILLSYGLASLVGGLLWGAWMASEQGQYRCDIASDLVVLRAGRPWRRYQERGSVALGEGPSTDAMMRTVARRLAARVTLDLEREERGEP
ncbi:MAG: hypothetical protein IT378_02765 [Sandaracinaceae bacterium]|nr:hypothetical protein [Sandaracinaceae bacterium]